MQLTRIIFLLIGIFATLCTLADQWIRLTGHWGQPKLDFAVSNVIAIPTNLILIGIAFGAAFVASRRFHVIAAISLLLLLVPAWLSVRHIYIGLNVVERVPFFSTEFSDMHLDQACYDIEGIYLRFGYADREDRRILVGFYPWSFEDLERVGTLFNKCE